MENVDFSICKFIKENMWFFTYYDFCDNRKEIKSMYEFLHPNAKLFYKWYLYSNIHMTEYFKNLIWTYLNFDDAEYEMDLLNAKKIYKVK